VAVRVPVVVGEKLIETAQLAPLAIVNPEHWSSTTVKSSECTAALLTKNDAPLVLVAVTVWDALVVPTFWAGKVSDDGENVTADAGAGGGVVVVDVGAGGDVVVVVDGVHPDSDAVTDVAPSLTVTWHVGELYEDFSILNEPLLSLVPVTGPGVIVMV
jgi:hypothetical protein